MNIYKSSNLLNNSNMKKGLICLVKGCRLIIEDPIVLPCGYSVCKHHFNEKGDMFICELCSKPHQVPNGGFPENLSLKEILHDGIVFSEIFNLTKKDLTCLIGLIKKPEVNNPNPELIIDDFFRDKERLIDLHREKMIEDIHRKSDELLKKLKEFEKDCITNSKKLEIISKNKMRYDEALALKLQLRQPEIESDMVILKQLNNKIITIKEEIINEFVSFKNESLMNKKIEFVPREDRLFGEVRITDLPLKPNRLWKS